MQFEKQFFILISRDFGQAKEICVSTSVLQFLLSDGLSILSSSVSVLVSFCPLLLLLSLSLHPPLFSNSSLCLPHSAFVSLPLPISFDATLCFCLSLSFTVFPRFYAFVSLCLSLSFLIFALSTFVIPHRVSFLNDSEQL